MARLNRERFAGRNNWRLPTIAELLSLMSAPTSEPTSEAALCTPPVFDRRQTTLWSIDRATFTTAWYADLELGFVGWQELEARRYVRAVCTAGTAA